MTGKHQIQRSVEIAAVPDTVWDILDDSTLLPQWAPPVEEVTRQNPGRETLGAVRECRVNFAGRTGTIVERCVELSPNTRIAYVVDDDTLGFNKMFAHYGFTITLQATHPQRTTARMDTYYTPRNPLAAALNTLTMRRAFTKTIDRLLQGLQRVAEEHAQRGKATQTLSGAG